MWLAEETEARYIFLVNEANYHFGVLIHANHSGKIQDDENGTGGVSWMFPTTSDQLANLTP